MLHAAGRCIRSFYGSTIFTYNPNISGVTEESQKKIKTMLLLLVLVLAAAVVCGCTSSAPPGDANATQDAYVDAYSTGMDHHSMAQDYFNEGTAAWEDSDFRGAVAGYANASMEYNDAANCYTVMAKYAVGPQDRQFADDLRGCALNMSLASDDFMNAAIALMRNDTDTAYAKFDQGQAHADAGDEMLNRSVDLTPDWLVTYAS